MELPTTSKLRSIILIMVKVDMGRKKGTLVELSIVGL